MNRKITLYTSPTCLYCKETKQFFADNKIGYEEKDVTKDAEAKREMVEKSGQPGTPVIDVDGQVIVGYNLRRLNDLLDIREEKDVRNKASITIDKKTESIEKREAKEMFTVMGAIFGSVAIGVLVTGYFPDLGSYAIAAVILFAAFKLYEKHQKSK